MSLLKMRIKCEHWEETGQAFWLISTQYSSFIPRVNVTKP